MRYSVGMKADDLWLEFINPDVNLCGLCGNTGIINTRGLVRSPAGVACGVLRFCICPNGRAEKDHYKGDVEHAAGIHLLATRHR